MRMRANDAHRRKAAVYVWSRIHRALAEMGVLIVILVVAIAIATESVGARQFTASNSWPEDSQKEIRHLDVNINSWAVKIRGGRGVADAVAHRHGYDNLGLVRNTHYTHYTVLLCG